MNHSNSRSLHSNDIALIFFSLSKQSLKWHSSLHPVWKKIENRMDSKNESRTNEKKTGDVSAKKIRNTNPHSPKSERRKKLRRENIIRIIPKRFQYGRRVFHSMLVCNHSLASVATVRFFSVCIAKCSPSLVDSSPHS